MDHTDQRGHQPPPLGVLPGTATQMPHSAPYHPTSMVPTATPAAVPVPVASPTQPPTSFPQQQLPYPPPQPQPFHNPQQQQQLQAFWGNQMQEIERTFDFKNHSLPLARIKKIMKADEDVRMISAEAPVVFAKACEIFILELTLRSWLHTEENKRRTLQKNDIAAAISRTDVFDFLVDIIPRDELNEDGLGINKPAIPLAGPAAAADVPPYYYMPQQHMMGPSGMMMGRPTDQAELYAAQHPRPNMPFMPWMQPQNQHLHQQPSEDQPSQQQPSDPPVGS